ncbi:MAG: tetratricopeptide repeat protein [Terriglobia bacterium]
MSCHRTSAIRLLAFLYTVCVLAASGRGLPQVAGAGQSKPNPATGKEASLKAILHQAQQASVAGHFANAETLYRKALQTAQQAGEHGPRIANILIALANLCSQEGETAQARAATQSALAINESSLASEQAEVAGNLSMLAMLYEQQKNGGRS